ncbi:PREDICTED: uncharacterized protein LOC108790648 [Nanorana parkeri]|uniref:uncharacterized protein LOC108790648 n=1 Tax=Nanorana parkeri TaxID=125878 RepID=UPI000854111C|nr:PREDICTED: uncharacterized protein LOC108790648 [Nanorana parkeri]
MVGSSYRGRTQLSRQADLQINGVQDTDHTTYYCFVMLKFCTGTHKSKSMLRYGAGTQLNVNENSVQCKTYRTVPSSLSSNMKVIQVLLTLLFIQGVQSRHVRSGEAGDVYSDKSFCTEQPDSIRVEKGGSVIIPCHFSYPNNITPTEVRVYWRRGTTGGYCGNNPFIYNHTENWTHGNYTGRISMEGNPEKVRTATIRIQRLKETDGPMFCCRISLRYNGDKKEEWQNRHGTHIKFKDQFSVEQPDVVPAVMGEDISIPCAVHYKSPDFIEEIIWRVGTSDVCSENPEFLRWNIQNMTHKVGRWTLQKSENIFSLHIKRVIDFDSRQYCCEVITKLRTEKQSSAHCTQVVIADPTQNDFRFTVTQSGIILANEGDSVTINCSYTVPPNQNLLWRGVFWRVGSPTGPYAYHPSDLMVGSSYRGRTQLSGQADLQINGVQDTDNTTYYCFVMLKFCTGANKSNSMLVYGAGTQSPQDKIKKTVPSSLSSNMKVIRVLLTLLIIQGERSEEKGLVRAKVNIARPPFLSPQDKIKKTVPSSLSSNMKVIRVLLTLLIIQGDVYSDGDKSFCTEQPDSIRVEKGGSVTIPCHFSYPNNNTPTEVRVYWRQGPTGGHCGQNPFIYNHTENYTGRISMEGNPKQGRTATIRIQRLKETDGPMFCCRISLRYNGDKTAEWQNRHGTYIKFKDQFSVEQPDVVPAVMGEDISIPCAVHNKSPDFIEEIIWRKGESDLCSENPEFLRWNKQNITQKFERWTVQKSEKIFSLHIKRVIDSDSRQYCCEVITKLRTQKQSSAHGTQVVIADPNQNDPEFTVSQSGIILANDSVTINCSYTVPPDQNLLWRGVFWRVGSPTGPYAYHPSDLMVNSSYIGRTQLSGQADLQIKEFQATDNTTYYCFVMLTFCIGNNKYKSTLRYATQFNGNRKNSTPTGILAGVGIILFLIVLCLILFILKKRGVICKKKESVKSSPSPVNHASSPPSTYDNDQYLLWKGVFWGVGSPTGPYAFHPSDLMVDSSYRGRTQLSGQADLQINRVQDTDHTTYYCSVMLKFCTGAPQSNSTFRCGGLHVLRSGIGAGFRRVIADVTKPFLLCLFKPWDSIPRRSSKGEDAGKYRSYPAR